jgi:hypothetical protein
MRNDLDEIKSKCEESQGYLVFSAHLTDDPKDSSAQMIEFQYRRNRFSLEDAKTALTKLKEFVDEELQSLIEADNIE